MVEENDYTGIISFPDFKVPPNPKYVSIFVKMSLKAYLERLAVRQMSSQMQPPSGKKSV
jgi:hypothetical protein